MATSKKETNIQDLPPEMILKITGYLWYYDKKRFGRTCKKFAKMMQDRPPRELFDLPFGHIHRILDYLSNAELGHFGITCTTAKFYVLEHREGSYLPYMHNLDDECMFGEKLNIDEIVYVAAEALSRRMQQRICQTRPYLQKYL